MAAETEHGSPKTQLSVISKRAELLKSVKDLRGRDAYTLRGKRNEQSVDYRMDRRNVESSHGMHESFPWLFTVLCGGLCGAI